MSTDTSSFDRLVEAGGQRLRVVVRPGEPGRTPLLLCNGIGAALESFQPFVDALDPGLPVIRFDPPGAGGSPLPSRPYRLPGLAGSVLALLEQLGHDRVDVLGISWGGALAQQLAFTGRRRCRRLVLVATATGALMVPGRPQVLLRLASPRRHQDPAYVLRVAPQLYGGSARRDPDLAARILHDIGRPGSPVGYAWQILATTGWTSLAFLPLLRQPTLVLTGDDDPIIPVVNGRLLASLIPHARLHIYRGGHIELVADPGQLVPVVEQFLRDDPAAAHDPRPDQEAR